MNSDKHVDKNFKSLTDFCAYESNAKPFVVKKKSERAWEQNKEIHKTKLKF